MKDVFYELEQQNIKACDRLTLIGRRVKFWTGAALTFGGAACIVLGLANAEGGVAILGLAAGFGGTAMSYTAGDYP